MDPIDPSGGEAHLFFNGEQEIPVDCIKGFLKVYLEAVCFSFAFFSQLIISFSIRGPSMMFLSARKVDCVDDMILETFCLRRFARVFEITFLMHPMRVMGR